VIEGPILADQNDDVFDRGFGLNFVFIVIVSLQRNSERASEAKLKSHERNTARA
jgi:hypothetical protein